MKKIGIISKTGQAESLKILKDLLPWLRKKGCEVYVDYETASELHIDGYQRSQIPAITDFIIVLGGDGTMLSVARLVGEKSLPILGVNIGGLGFLTAVQKEEIYEVLEKVMNGQCPVEERMMLTACVLRHGECIAEYLVVNDVVVNKGALARIIDLETYIDHNYVATFKADGLIVSTPTGSTAYALSAGGPIVEPKSEVIIITPICPHTLLSRSIVLSPDNELEIIISSRNETDSIGVDGKTEQVSIKPDHIFKVKKSKSKLKLITFNKDTFFKVFKEKFIERI